MTVFPSVLAAAIAAFLTASISRRTPFTKPFISSEPSVFANPTHSSNRSTCFEHRISLNIRTKTPFVKVVKAKNFQKFGILHKRLSIYALTPAHMSSRAADLIVNKFRSNVSRYLIFRVICGIIIHRKAGAKCDCSINYSAGLPQLNTMTIQKSLLLNPIRLVHSDSKLFGMRLKAKRPNRLFKNCA